MIASTNQFLERIKHVKLEPDESMLSHDVDSHLSSTPQQLAIDVMSQLLPEHYEERKKPLESKHLLELLRHCLRTYFNFDGLMYEQIKGSPIDSPIRPECGSGPPTDRTLGLRQVSTKA
ncbi:unnamed protein product [Schistocephalus solidus]|uniref:Uncharacterized protein n=1 Tax=Schistocephalus solidus TaxID=70667 RepID=A0A183T5J1_SCHSO|nr:unnamed protein product [Schistocephalus solidus]